jgi:hypothetical protein
MNSIIGKTFISGKDEEYGIIRKAELPFPNEISTLNVIAEDECGNYFIEVAGEVFFWDHETSERTLLSSSIHNFISGCAAPSEIELKPDQVTSAWIDPEFAKKFGIEPKP